MSKISAYGIQMFVAGALAVSGFQSLCEIPNDISSDATGGFLIFFLSVSIVWSFALLIGIAMFIGRAQAIRWASIYLWCDLVVGIVGDFGGHVLDALGAKTYMHISWWRGISDMVAPVALLWLLAWSRSKRFQSEQMPNTY